MKCDQHAAHNPKLDGIIQLSLMVVLEKIKWPAHMVEGGYHLRNRTPTSTHKETRVVVLIQYEYTILSV